MTYWGIPIYRLYFCINSSIISFLIVPCKSPWKAFAGECYLVRLSSVNWYQGRHICERLRSDADLAEVNSLAVQYFLNGKQHWLQLKILGLPFLAIGGLSCGFHEILIHSLPPAHHETEGFVLN